jgi:hypothetical protein
MLTQEQTLARLLVVALHQLGGHMEVSEQLLDNMGHYNIVWEHVEPVKDQIGLRVSLRSGDVLIASIDDNVVSVVL